MDPWDGFVYNWSARIHVNIQFYVNNQLVTLKKIANGTPYFNIVSLNHTVKDYPMSNNDGTPVSGARETYIQAQLTTAGTSYNLNGLTVTQHADNVAYSDNDNDEVETAHGIVSWNGNNGWDHSGSKDEVIGATTYKVTGNLVGLIFTTYDHLFDNIIPPYQQNGHNTTWNEYANAAYDNITNITWIRFGTTLINSDIVMPTAPIKPMAPTLQKFILMANVHVPAIHPVKQASVKYHLYTINQINQAKVTVHYIDQNGKETPGVSVTITTIGNIGD